MKSLYFYILIIMIAVVVGTAGYFYYAHPKMTPVPQHTTTSADGKITCNYNDNYFVVTRPRDNAVGSDILFKKITEGSVLPECAYIVAPEDYEVVAAESPEYFLALTDNYLVIDKGTAPQPRTLVVYDYSTHTSVFTDSYSLPLTSDDDTLTYWNPTTSTPTQENCPDLSSNTQNGLGSMIENQVRVDLKTFEKSILPEARCVATQ